MLTRLNQLWVADITYIAIATGFVYVAAILDAWSRRVVGYATGTLDSAPRGFTNPVTGSLKPPAGFRFCGRRVRPPKL